MMKCLGKSVALVVVLLISTTCLAQVEVIRAKKDGRVISGGSTPALLGKRSRQKAPKTVDVVAAALEHLKQHGGNFGVSDVEQELRLKEAESDSLGMTHVHLSQFYKQIPVFGGDLIVHVNSDGTLRSINGNFTKGIELETTPSLTEEGAAAKVQQYWTERHGDVVPEIAAPALWVFDGSVLGEGGAAGVRLVWKVEARNLESGLREDFFVDAKTGELAWWLNEVAKATQREVYDCSIGCVIDYYDSTYNYIFGRSEGQPIRGINPITATDGDDRLYDRLEMVRRYYVDVFNRNGANGYGGLGDGTWVPVTTARAYLVDYAGQNNGYYIQVWAWSSFVDLLGHEYSHSVPMIDGSRMTGHAEHGGLGETFAQTQGEGFEQYLKGSADWIDRAEDGGPDGALFNWAYPKDPNTPCEGYGLDRYNEQWFPCSQTAEEHSVSSVPMYGMYLMSAGGTFNGCTMHGIGLERTLQILYRAFTVYFTLTTRFNEAYTYFGQACKDLYTPEGSNDPFGGPICYQVVKALRAVEMDQLSKCVGGTEQVPQCDFCPDDPNKTDPGCNGCGVADTDSDGDGTPDCYDLCPNDSSKVTPGRCGCGAVDLGTNQDGTPNCDLCPNDPAKTDPGACGCGVADTDSDNDGTPDCHDACPSDPNKTAAGQCGCGVADTDSDGDGVANCNDGCPSDPNKTAAGQCGCGVADTDSDGDGVANCNDGCPSDPNKTAAGQCGCGVADTDSDGDGVANCNDGCPSDPNKTAAGQCGCGVADTDSDGDGTPNCHDQCPNDPAKTAPGACGCGVADVDTDHDSTMDCNQAPLPPTIGSATRGNGQATVSFTPPTPRGNPVTSYTVTSNPGAKTARGSASPLTVTGLTNGTSYTFRVTATNSVGDGAQSAASNAVTPMTYPGAPTIGTATGGNAQATVTFTAPASNGGSAITSYTVTSNPDGKTAMGSASPLTVTGLTNGTSYTFTVKASNSMGPGDASAASNSVTPVTVPGAPTIGTATGGNALATVSFTAPASNGGSPVTFYTVTSNPGGLTATGSASPLTVTGLTNGTSYTFKVTATNSVGPGERISGLE